MEKSPFVHQFESLSRKGPLIQVSGLDLDQGLVSGIDGMKMRRGVIAMIKPDDDSVKPTDLRHG
jgi:hypothetical protein